MQAITILKANGFVSRPLVESLSEKIALDYLKLPIVVWVCLSQAKPTQASVLSPTECLDDVASPQTATARGLAGSKRSTTEAEPAQERKEESCHKKARKSSDSGDELAPVTAATVSDRINRYCQEVGHDPAFFQVKSVSSVYCLVCNKTFKLHGRGQITRVKRHVKGEGKKGLSRHMHNLLSVKEKLRTQQIPMLWQIPVHILQQVQQARLQVASFAGVVPPTLPAAGGSGGHLPHLPMLANIRPATAAARSPLPPSAGLVPPSPTVNTMRSCSPTGGGLHLNPFPAPLLSQAMAAVPSLQMLQSPSSPLPQPTCPPAVPVAPASPSVVARLGESPLHLHGQRQQLDNDTGLVHCHCLSPAKPVLVREPTTTTTTTSSSMASMEGIEVDGGGGNSDDEDDEDQQQAFRNGRRYYICHRRRSDEGCTFVKPSNEFTRLINDDRLEELDLHDESLQGYVDQNLVEDDDDGGAGAFDDDNGTGAFDSNDDNGTGAFDSNDDSDDQQFGNHNHHDEDDDDGCGLIIHEDFHHEDGADVGLHMEAGEVESPSTLVMALITDEGDEPSAADTGDAALRHHSEERRLDDEEDESQGSPLEVELNEGGSEGAGGGDVDDVDDNGGGGGNPSWLLEWTEAGDDAEDLWWSTTCSTPRE
ncbi:uncharacterized protein ACA1_197890 [Acanthamoeba castellanii str. Neff]|uniref:Uncharacterized protein n=1 Tax=Acanthamoeba castellanii (strain ATCC 30010 / Neff) TaxID=1257118 RepID=L8H2B0_ACACF|nr:uncharacterized protein ACA1_197890 [Acanthamoeba castellanii str. Neff]ELR19599.1 hypothetical protein ACA1_197890 [Acanthamoeba castellanii str. Neff]